MNCMEMTTMGQDTRVYARVSGDTQTLAQQLREILSALPRGLGKPKVMEEVASGKDNDRPVYSALKKDIKAGKVKHLYVWALDRLGRNAKEIRDFVDLCVEMKVSLVSVKEKLDLESPWRDVFVAILATMAEMERQRISERTKAKFKQYREVYKWRSHGSPPASAPILSAKIIRHVPAIHRAREAGMTIRQIASAFACTSKTVMKILNRPGEKWMTRQEWVRKNPDWYKSPQDYGAPPTVRSQAREQSRAV